MRARRLLWCVALAVGAALGISSTPASAALTHPFVSSFGSFTNVQGVAVDQSTGDVYVLDAGAEGGSLLKFDASGKQLKFAGLAGEPSAIAGLGGGGNDENELAVDNSKGATKGDVYVAVSTSNGERVDIFAPDGKSLGDLSGEGGEPWGESCGVAVGPAGAVYVGLFGTVDKFVPTGNPVTNTDYVGSIGGATRACNVAVDTAENVFGVAWSSGPVTRYEASQLGSSSATGSIVDRQGSTVAVDPADEHVYVNERTQIAEFGASGEPFATPLGTFGNSGAGALTASFGVAVDGASGDIYAPSGSGALDVFGPAVTVPTVVGEPASQIGVHSATLSGSVNPEGVAVTSCRIEYGTSSQYGQSAPCPTSPGSGNSAVAESLPLSDLQGNTLYHFQIVASNANGEGASADRTFTTLAGAATEPASKVTVAEATLNGTVNPGGISITACEFQYGVTSGYGKSAPCNVNPGAGNAPVAVSAALTGLQFMTEYHYRLVIDSQAGPEDGSDQVAVTATPKDATSAALADGRMYELVSRFATIDAEVYEPGPSREYSNVYSRFPFQAAADGSAMAFVGSPSVDGGESAGVDSGNQYLARRTADGVWENRVLTPTGIRSAVFQGFSSDLSIGFLDSLQALAPQAPGVGGDGNGYDVLYTTETAEGSNYTPLLTATPPYRSGYEFQTPRVYRPGLGIGRDDNYRMLVYAGASQDSSHVLFEANDALTPGAEGGAAEAYVHENNLYEWAGGHLRLVNVLPDGSTEANATFGSDSFGFYGPTGGEYASPVFSHVISNDGSRIFWTDVNNGHIYVREDGTRTVEISSAGTYQTASADGSKVFYTDGDLYEYDVETGAQTDLTPGVEVMGVVGASEDGDYVYYLTQHGDLELWHEGATTQIETLPAPYTDQSELQGDWLNGFADRTAEVTPDGHSVVFSVPQGGEFERRTLEVYDADTGNVYCVSCGSGGSTGSLPQTFSNTYQKRWISEDGSRVFFDSFQALVPQDTNGKQDAYEWERPGAGDCTAETGCIHLLSSGASTSESDFLDASASGDDAFIVTRSRLVSEDEDEQFDVYDARANGVAPIAPSQCTGTGCQGLPGAPPIFATPSSVTFEGVGNFTSPTSVSATPKSKPKSKHKKSKRRQRSKGKRRHKVNQRQSRRGAKAKKAAGLARGSKRPSGNGERS